jgi:hypothetical protein
LNTRLEGAHSPLHMTARAGFDPTASNQVTAGAETKAKRPNFFSMPRRNRILRRIGFPGFHPIGHLIPRLAPPIATADISASPLPGESRAWRKTPFS